jgi:RNA polymerase sigma-70 factor (ECF subfamily)
MQTLSDNPSLSRDLGVADSTVSAASTDPTPTASLLDRITFRFKCDEDLAACLHDGQTEAMTVLFERHSALIYGVVWRIVRVTSEAEDVVQQTFLDVFRSIGQFDSRKGPLKSWLLMFAYQRALNRKRDLKARGYYTISSLEDVLPQALTGSARALPSSLNSAEASCLVEQALSTIQPRQRRVIELVYYEGLTSDEVANVTGESVRVVRHNLYRGLEKMRGILHRVAPAQAGRKSENG